RPSALLFPYPPLCRSVVDPKLLAGRAVGRRYRASRARRRIKHAVHHHGRALEAVLGRRPEIQRAETPRQLERAEVARVDLLERRIARVSEVSAVAWPLEVVRTRLRERG